MRWLITIIMLLNTATALAIIPGSIVFDPTVDADIVETFSYFKSEISALEKQLTDLDNELKLLSASQYLWSDTATLITQLNNTMNQASALSYTAQNQIAQFNKLFPGYISLNNFNEQYQQITRTSLDTLNNILQSFGKNSANFIPENNQLKSLQHFTQNISGQTQAIQMVVQLTSEQISQLQLLRQAVMAEANAQAVYFAQQIQTTAAAVAELNDIIAHGDTKTTGALNTHPWLKPNYDH